MKWTRADCRTAVVAMAAGVAMVLCFVLRSTAMIPMNRLPWEPPGLAARTDRAGLVDINAAGLEELMALPGIGQARAQAILDDREQNGPFRYPEDLIRVRGIGEGILSELLDQITTGGDEDAENFSG